MEDEVAEGQWLDCSEEPEGTVFTVEPCSNEYCTCTTGYEFPLKNVSLTTVVAISILYSTTVAVYYFDC